MTFEQLISTLKSNAATNHHIENLILIAQYYNYTRLIRLLGLVSMISEIERGSPQEIVDYRYRLYKEMMELVHIENPTEHDQIQKSL